MQGSARKTGAHHALLAGFLGWTLDAFDFFVIVFLYDNIVLGASRNCSGWRF
jgi:hypothetical protein